MLFSRIALAAAVALTSVWAGEASGIVPLLTSKNFDAFIKEHPMTLVKFMAPWCGHCKSLAPEYEAAAEELKLRGVDVQLTEVDATEEKELAEKYGVQGFPSMFMFKDGTPEPYSGGRTKDTIVEWVETLVHPSVEWLESQTAAAKLQEAIKSGEAKTRVGFFGSFPSQEHEAALLFTTVADNSRHRGKFFAVVDAKGPQIVCQRSEEDATSSNKVFTNKDRLTAWVHGESFHLFSEISPETYPAYGARSPNWVWFAAEREDFEKYAPAFRRVSRNYRTDFNFVWLNVAEHKSHAESGLSLTTFPGIAVEWQKGIYHYTDALLTEKVITKFIENIKRGKAPKFVKSEPIPETNDKPVKVVVGKNFSEMVLQKDKDVFLKIYAPWCGHCQKLAPLWEELAAKTQQSPNLIIADFDGTANSPDTDGFEYEGFPMLYFVPAGAKEPIKFDGDRTVEGMLAFVQQHAKHPVIIGAGENKDEL